ncbi:MAG: hypothetical protein CMJ89_16290 [Planctomycetes bacterium]|jgi:putative CocE/NonD family hydrolase|nr:hypothetical protein [Planctomycetota bacterium]
MFRNSYTLLAALPIAASSLGQSPAWTQVSSFGEYEGYSAPRFDGYLRESFYIEMRDGVELACDLYRPSLSGEVTEEPLPLVWTHDRYHRAAQSGRRAIATKLVIYPWLNTMLNHGYLVAAVDVRGAGASFGTWDGIFNETETGDAYDIVEWFADQEWCDGNIGMYGGSYLGGTQYMAASRKPPHLKALFPWVAPADLYEITWSGGIFRDDLVGIWTTLTHDLDRSPAVASVDWDDGFELKKSAQQDHESNRNFEPVVRSSAFRDSEYEGRPLWVSQSPISYVEAIEESGVAIYHQGGWFDPFSRDSFAMFGSLDNPQKIVMGPWFHSRANGVDWNAEALRWFDRWLKGIENGVMEEDAIHFYTMFSPGDGVWCSTDTWPLPDEERAAYFFNAGPSGSIDSKNDGLLSREPESVAGLDEGAIDYSLSSGLITRWSNAVGKGGANPSYKTLETNDAGCLTYTTPVLEEDLEVTGHPIVHLWTTVVAPDADFFVYLEEVLPDGTSHYVSEGCLRATHRRLSEPPYDRMGLPYHSCFEKDVLAVPEGPMELVFDLFPVSNLFQAGNRLRVSIAGADDQNALTNPQPSDSTMRIHRGAQRASYIDLPILQGGGE